MKKVPILRVTASQLHDICHQVAHDAEREVCGIIGGEWIKPGKLAIAREIVAIPNLDPHPGVRFEMEPSLQARTMLDFAKRGLDLVGVYHSHPKGPPYPSEQDLNEYMYYEALYLVVFPVGILSSPSDENKASSGDTVMLLGYAVRGWKFGHKSIIAVKFEVEA